MTELLSDEEFENIQKQLEEKYVNETSEIVEEPQLFSEISDNDVKEYEQGILEVPDEDI